MRTSNVYGRCESVALRIAPVRTCGILVKYFGHCFEVFGPVVQWLEIFESSLKAFLGIPEVEFLSGISWTFLGLIGSGFENILKNLLSDVLGFLG